MASLPSRVAAFGNVSILMFAQPCCAGGQNRPLVGRSPNWRENFTALLKRDHLMGPPSLEVCRAPRDPPRRRTSLHMIWAGGG